MLLRDHEGSLLGLVTAKFPPPDPDVAEARAARMAIAEAHSRGWNALILEDDSLNTINQILGVSKTY